MLLLVPHDPLANRKVDEHFAPEAAAAREFGADVVLVDHDALREPSAASAAFGRVDATGDAVYRGWMLRSEEYAALAAAASRRGIRLRTDTSAYQRGHELPGWYTTFESLTPESAWTDSDSLTAFEAACRQLSPGPAVLRDYVKSMKHYWEEAAYIPDVNDVPRAKQIAKRFHELRGDDFVGGFVVRRFEQFTSAEVRTWWLHGRCFLITPHPDSPQELPPDELDLNHVTEAVARLASPFVTVDVARRTDGHWRVIEVGDGQVSDRPSSTPPDVFMRPLLD